MSKSKRTENSEAKPAGVLPFSVKQWLVAKYLADPSPRECEVEQDRWEPIVFAAFEDFTGFLQGERIDILPNLDEWNKAGWIEDIKNVLPSGEERRLVGIRKAVLDAPTSPSGKGGRGRKPESNPEDDRRIYERWKSSGYRTIEEYATKNGLKRRNVELAIDRHEKRQKNSKKK